jgi:hypothetical protein
MLARKINARVAGLYDSSLLPDDAADSAFAKKRVVFKLSGFPPGLRSNPLQATEGLRKEG